jgi:hypothetical protein
MPLPGTSASSGEGPGCPFVVVVDGIGLSGTGPLHEPYSMEQRRTPMCNPGLESEQFAQALWNGIADRKAEIGATAVSRTSE